MRDRQDAAILQGKLEEILAHAVDDPVFFFEHILGVHLRQWQRTFLSSIADRLAMGDRRLTAIARTCHGAGKTLTMAGLALWWTCTRPEARGITLAQSWAGVENLVWPEIDRLYRKSLLEPLGFGRLITTRFEVSRSWYLVGLSSDRPFNLEGHHSPIAAARFVDEAKAVTDPIIDATMGMLDAPETLDFQITTPSICAGRFWELDTKGGPDIIRAVVTIDELVAEGIPGRREWRDDVKRRWGEGSPTYRARAMAEYIQSAEGVLFPPGWVDRAMESPLPRPTDHAVIPRIGMDVAGSVDGDENAVSAAYGPDRSGRYWLVLTDTWREVDTMRSKGRLLSWIDRLKADKAAVDVIGIGKGLHDAARAETEPNTIMAYRAADAATDRTRFGNRKAEDCWALRDLLEKNLVSISRDQLLRDQMTGMRYKIDRGGRISVEDPEPSPDRLDSLLLALACARWAPVAPGAVRIRTKRSFLV